MLSTPRTLAGVFAGLLLSAVTAQGPVSLVKDINTTPLVNGNGDCRFFANIGGLMYFAGTDSLSGQELWVTDGTQAGTRLLKDINPGPANGAPFGFVDIGGGVILFQATDASTGQELWRTDGTAAGTVLVKDIRSGPNSSMQFPRFAVLNGVVYFSASEPASASINNFELWRSDGTASGTYLLKEINASPTAGSSPGNLTVVGNLVLFTANDGVNGAELWTTDGTAAGTNLLLDILPGSTGSSPGNFLAYGSRLLFGAFTGSTGSATGNELWISDGTAAGTQVLKDINPGTASGGPTGLVPYGGLVYFTANDGTNGSELWRTDGTTAGTVMAHDINPGSGGGFPGFLTVSGGKLFFQAFEATYGAELYVTDGTTLTFLGDLEPGTNGSNPNFILDSGNGFLVFRATITGAGQEPWRSDGTVAGTFALGDFSPGTPNSAPNFLYTYQNRAYFMLNTLTYGSKLWATDGTVAGTSLFLDTDPPKSSSSPAWIIDARGVQTAIFAANDGVNGLELWKSDGTAAGTVMIKDINPNAGVGSGIVNLTAVGSRAFFVADDGTNGRELWVTDGTTAGTNLVLDIRVGISGSNPSGLTEYKGALWFAATEAVAGAELWTSDGTGAGTVRLVDINPGTSSSGPANLTVVKDKLFFTATNGTATPATGVELWMTDGSAAGTVPVADINPGTASSSPSLLTRYNDLLLFNALTAANGRELWISDGTTAGTVMLLDIEPGTGSSVPNILGVANGLMLFAATQSATTGTELWRTDGTVAGTAMVKDIASGLGSSNPIGFASLGAIGLFYANDGVAGYELWRTDGTIGGASLVKDINPGGGGSFHSLGGFVRALPGANRAMFAASDGVNGVEMWVSDGTAAGTVMHHDIAPGLLNSNPSQPVQAGSILLFPASNGGAQGIELYAMASMANAEPYGFSCPGTGGKYPHISGAGGAPVLGNGSFGARVDNALALAPAVALVHLRRAEIPLGNGCTYYCDPTSLLMVSAVLTDAQGNGVVSLPIPADPSLASGQLFVQHLVLDPNGAFLNQGALTEGLKLVLSNN